MWHRSKLGSECLVKAGRFGNEDSTCYTKTQETTSEYHGEGYVNGTHKIIGPTQKDACNDSTR